MTFNVYINILTLIKICGELTALYAWTGAWEIEHFMLLNQPQCQLRLLDLSLFDDFCVAVLANALKFNEHLIILQLANCTISPKGLFSIAKMFQVNNVLE